MGTDFYQSLTPFSGFSHVADEKYTSPAPSDWWLIVTDIKGSTRAIESGHYRDVNLTGAACIIATINACKGIAIPYIFGGDGATLLIPPEMRQHVAEALSSVQAKTSLMFDLELRVGMVEVGALHAHGAALRVGKLQMSSHVQQAVFQGNATGLAEKWLKEGGGALQHCIPTTPDTANLSGLECRWIPVNQQNGEILSVIIKITPEHEAHASMLYESLLADIDAIYPAGIYRQPSPKGAGNITLSPLNFRYEAGLRTRNTRARIAYMCNMMLTNLVGRFSIFFKTPVFGFDGARYFSEVLENTDSCKFDDMLKFIFDSTPEQRTQLEAMLKTRKERGEIVYGIHSAPSALMTCLIFNRQGNHIHFVDGSNGGYALAAKQMKSQMSFS